MSKKDEENIFNLNEDKSEFQIEFNASANKDNKKTIFDEANQIISQLHTSKININNLKPLLKDAIEAADTNSINIFIKRISTMQAQHKKFFEALKTFNNNENLSQKEIENIQEEIEKNTDILKETEVLLDIANDSLKDPEKHRKDFETRLAQQIKQKKEENSQEDTTGNQNQKPNKPKENNKIEKIVADNTIPIVVDVKNNVKHPTTESGIDIEISGTFSGQVNVNKDFLLSKKSLYTNKTNNEKDNKKENYNYSKTFIKKQDKQKTTEEKKTSTKKEKADEYDLMMNKSGSNAKKLVEFHIEDIDK